MTTRQFKDDTEQPPSSSIEEEESTNKDEKNNSDNDDDTEEAQIIAKIIFLRVEPIIRKLLDLIRRYQSAKSVETEEQQQQLGLLQMQAVLLEQLQQIVPTLGKEYHLSPEQVSNSVILLVDFLLLPILAILRGTKLPWSQADHNSLDDDHDVDDHHHKAALAQQSMVEVVESASLKTVSLAARVLVAIVESLHHPTTTTSNLSTEKSMQCLVACAAALPSGPQSCRYWDTTTRRLDRGDACIQSILQAIECLVVRHGTTTCDDINDSDSNNNNNNKQAFVAAFCSSMNGALLARIVDCLVNLVEPPSYTNDLSSRRKVFQNINNKELQIQALQTLQSLMNCILDSATWQQLFPGTFAGLYRNILQSLRVAQQSSRVVTLALDVVCCLLRRVLLRTNSSSGTQNEAAEETTNALARLRALSKQSNSGTTTKQQQQLPSCEANEFIRRAKELLPGTLTVLIHMLFTARTAIVRQKAVSLNRIVLVEAPSFFGKQDLLKTSLEACLVLSQDTDQEVAANALALLKEYQHHFSDHKSKTSVGPRILELVGSLPALVEGSSEVQLQSTLKLIAAYLTWASSSQKKVIKKLRSHLTCESSIAALRQGFAAIFASSTNSDDGSIMRRKRSVAALVLLRDDPYERSNKVSTTSQLSENTREVAKESIGCLANALGGKWTAVVVDTCMADLYESCVSRVESGLSLEGPSQVAWVNSWIGSIVMAEYLLLGCFSRPSDARDGKKQHYLHTLATSILPLVTSYPLWELPVDSRVIGQEENLGSKLRENAVPSAYEANVTMTVALLSFVDRVLELMGEEGKELLSAVLFPILERTELGNRSISDAAYTLLQTTARSWGYSGTPELLIENMDSLLGAMMARIRVPGGRSMGAGIALDKETIRVANVAGLIFRLSTPDRTTSEEIRQCGTSRMSASTLAGMEELARELIDRFNRASSRLGFDEIGSIAFLQLFRSVADHFLAGRQPPETDEGQPISSDPWFKLLEPFERTHVNPCDCFAKSKEEDNSGDHNGEKEDGLRLQRETEFAALIVARSLYMLSHGHLTIQIQSCEVLISSFRFLAWAASVRIAWDGEEPANGPQNAVLRQIHSAWPAIMARLKATSAEVRLAEGVSIVMVSVPPISRQSMNNLGQKRIFLSKLFELVATLCESSDDFMARMFREAVWPVLGEIISNFLPGSGQKKIVSSATSVRYKLSGSEHALLQAVLDCLRRVFGHRPTGLALVGLVPSVGTLLFPFLDSDSEEIVSSCSLALESLLRIDCDALWRPLVDMSGQAIGPCPLACAFEPTDTLTKLVEDVTRGQTSSPHTARIAKKLLEFIDSLPEQLLE